MQSQSAQDFWIQIINDLIEGNQVEDAIKGLTDLDKKTNAGINKDVSLISSNFREVQKQFDAQMIGFPEYNQYKARARNALLNLTSDLPRRLDLNARIQGGPSLKFEVPDTMTLEAVLGQTSHLLKIGWLDKARSAANAVCRVVCESGKVGTGFLTQDGYIFTNNHVLGSEAEANTARVEFDYEEGRAAKSYQLDVSDFKTSPQTEYDFARVKVVDRADAPLNKWGFVEFERETLPIVGEAVTIIQHPEGQEKQIALTANKVISQMKQYLFYETDTKKGSSGSPVFNNNWKVVAIHHAGKKIEDGGLVINEQGTTAAANRGILFRDIFAFIGK